MAKLISHTSGFMLSSILGILVSLLFVFPISETWGFAFLLVFIIMFISSIVTMGQIEAHDEAGLQELAIHEMRKRGRENAKKK